MEKDMLKKRLIIYSILIPPIMIFVFYSLSNIFGKTLGYFIPYGVYLIILICGVIIFRINKYVKYDDTRGNLYYYALAFVPVLATFFVAFLPTVRYLKLGFLLVLLLYAVVNGCIEELFWRYTFNRVYGENMMKAYILPTIIFSCWHFALLFAKDVSYHGGALALVGGATIMGVIWGFVMFKTKNIKVVICAHVLANFFAFSQLLYQNWFS